MKLKEIIESPKVKSRKMEDLRMAAQTLSAAEERLRDLMTTNDKESPIYTTANEALNHVIAARKSFKSIM